MEHKSGKLPGPNTTQGAIKPNSDEGKASDASSVSKAKAMMNSALVNSQGDEASIKPQGFAAPKKGGGDQGKGKALSGENTTLGGTFNAAGENAGK